MSPVGFHSGRRQRIARSCSVIMSGFPPALRYTMIARMEASSNAVMPGLVPGIHVLLSRDKDVDGRDKPGHDEFTRRHSIVPRARAVPMLAPCLQTQIQSGAIA